MLNQMKIITLHSNGKCRIWLQKNLISKIGKILNTMPQFKISKRVVIIADKNVPGRIIKQITTSLEDVGISFSIDILGISESQKTLYTCGIIYKIFGLHKIDRWTPILAVGGGCLGDVVGFAASTYMRGLPLFFVPTTIIAQVDASIGGKNGVNMPNGKNLIGTFYQPIAIFVDPCVLTSLTSRDISNGFAEIIKYGIIEGGDFFRFLKRVLPISLETKDIATWEEIIYQCIKIKVQFVEQDEKEQNGRRSILNYGHTIGHVIEAIYRYKKFSHGEAISIGMECSAKISCEMGIAKKGVLIEQNRLLTKCNLPTRVYNLNIRQVENFLKMDKKTVEGRLQFVLPKDIGRVIFPVFVPTKIINAGLKYVSK